MREAASEPPANLRQVAPVTSIFGFDSLGSPRLCENQLLRKALSEPHQQLEWAIELNLPPQQCPHHVFFLSQKADPRLRVSGNVQIRLADMPLFHAYSLVLNDDSCLPLLMAGESEVESGIQSRRLAGLEDARHSIQENLYGVRPQAVAHVLDLFVGKPFADMILSVGILRDVNRLFLLLKGPHDLFEVCLPIGEERSNDIFSGRADRQTVRGFIVRPVGQTLPHRSRLR